MITKILTLFKIARRIAQSDIINIVSKFHEVPKTVKFFCYILSFSFSNSNKLNNKSVILEIRSLDLELMMTRSTKPHDFPSELLVGLD